MKYITKSLWLLFFTVILGCIIYPGLLWVIGQTLFPFQANGSMLNGPDGTPVGSRLIAQPFTKDGYFQPRPSACSYDASASASSTLAASNYALRGRVAASIGSIAIYKSGANAGKPVGPDVETWFQADRFQGNPGIVQQWADAHNGMAQGWVKADPTHLQYVTDWSKAHPDIVTQFIKDNPATPQPAPADLAVVFFDNFSKENPGKFPAGVAHPSADGKTTAMVIEPVKEGSDIQANFFDLWLQEHPDADLQQVPGDLVTTSGSGLDPHITLQNAEFQLDRVAAKWAADTKKDAAAVRQEIEQLLERNASAPLGGLAGEKLIDVLEVNLELRRLFGAPS